MRLLKSGKNKTIHLGKGQTFLAIKIVNIIIEYQIKIATKLQSGFNRLSLTMQKLIMIIFFSLATSYCTSLIFKKSINRVSIGSIKVIPNKKLSSIDSINKLEIIYQIYLKP
ncbi:hypothetical protein A5893_02090 [Pedobacter psychrophilus]|uniref:Uncharacterized protein n=1 Tax=Pedobacter psychrophilus TaxID=1826909 RepID=A0A179DMH5_9SPHI|nr:hypothetical protein [Pedobacter psychrophilus]OAQ41930.1 hypothetical protein A5893_02090 [Pedobacter psychrophilus]